MEAWLHLGNTLQILDNEGNGHAIATSSGSLSKQAATVTAPTSPAPVDLSKSIVSDEVLELATTVASGGVAATEGG